MSYVIKAVLSNPRRPEYGQMTILFPIPDSKYDHTIELLEAMGSGAPTAQDCRVDELDSSYPILNRLLVQSVSVDELDYLAKRLDSFCEGEDSQFEAMAHKLGISTIKDFINRTFCCQQATSSEQAPYPSLPPSAKAHSFRCSSSPNRTRCAGLRFGLLPLKCRGGGTVTPYGVVYGNGIRLGPPCGLPHGERRSKGAALGRAAGRSEYSGLCDDEEHLSGDDLPGLNRLCLAVAPLNDTGMEKLNAALLLAELSGVSAVCRLAEHLEQFDFIPGIHTPEEYGRHIIRESGCFDYDENLEDFYDYRRYGEQRIRQEGGQFNACGYVAYRGAVPLEALMHSAPAEQRQGPRMGGLSYLSSGGRVIGEVELPAPLKEFKGKVDEIRAAGQMNITPEVFGADFPVPTLSWQLHQTRLDSDATFQKLNRLAEAIDGMDAAGHYQLCRVLSTDYKQSLDEVLQTAIHMKPPGLDCFEHISGVTSHQELGRWLVEHDRLEDKVPEALRPYLDYHSIGIDYCNEHEGELLADSYVGIPPGAMRQSILHLTLSTEKGIFLLSLPASDKQLEQAKRSLGVEDFAQAGITAVKFSIPYLADLLPLDTVSVEAQRQHAGAVPPGDGAGRRRADEVLHRTGGGTAGHLYRGS